MNAQQIANWVFPSSFTTPFTKDLKELRRFSFILHFLHHPLGVKE